MSTDFQENGREGETQATAVQEGTPTEALVASAVGDRCVNCGATLQSDQRYCVICGERRGAPRFSLSPATVTTEVTTTTSSITGRGGSRSPRWGSPTTLIAGVGTLLLALLVGFLIGNAATKNNNVKPVASAPPVIKVVNTGGGGAAATSSGTSTTPSSSAGKSTSSKKSKSSAPKATTSKKQSTAESNAASKVTGGTNAPPASTKVGQKCAGSACNKAGYNKKTHKFDGSFFGQ